MSLQEVLTSIRTAGEAELRQLEAQNTVQVREILMNAEAEAHEIREEACAAASAPAGSEHARILHRARLESLHNLGSAREALIDSTLDQARGRLGNLRTEKTYPQVLQQLILESLAEIKTSTNDISQVWLEADPLDQELVTSIITDMGLSLTVKYCLNSWGGVIARSEDGRIVVINTLETRLERAIPYLHHYLAALYEENPLMPETVPPELKTALST